MLIYKNKYAILLAGIIVISIISTLHLFSIFTTTNQFINDVLSRYSFNTPVSEKVIIVEVDSSFIKQGDEIWITALKNLFDQKAKQVVFNFLPEQASNDFYKLAAQSKKVVFGYRSLNHLSSYPLINTLPKSMAKNKVDWGFIMEISQQGVYRTQPMHLLINDEIELPSFEFIVAKQLLGNQAETFDATFQINFTGGVERLPVIKLRSLLSKGIVQEFVNGRTVFIAAPDLENGSHFFTPIVNQNGQLSAVLLHAFALDTLISHRVLQPLTEKTIYFLIATITLCSLCFYSLFSFRASGFIVSALSLFFLFLCWFLLHKYFLLLPVIEFLLASWLTVWIIDRYYLAQNQRSLEVLLFDLSLKLQKKVFSVNFDSTQDSWGQSIAMMNQTLNLNRLIFLERVSNSYWLKEVKCFNCNAHDINEKRRDYRRVPYITAVQENRPILLDELPYLKNTTVAELNYLAPLIFDNHLVGFWVFTIEADKVHSTEEFLALTQVYMSKIAESLYYYQAWQNRIKFEQNKLMNYFSLQINKEAYQMLNQSVRLLERRLLKLHEGFNRFTHAIVLYDLFGRAILINNSMESIAQAEQFSIYDISLLNFMVKLTGFDTDKTRHILQQIICNKLIFSLTVSNLSAQHHYILTVQLLNPMAKKDDLLLKDDNQMIEYQEIFCELKRVDA